MEKESLKERLEKYLSETELLQQKVSEGISLREIARIDSREFHYYLDYAHKLKEQGKMETASDVYFALIFLDPGSYEAWMGYGKCEKKLEQYENALAAFQNAISMKSESPTPYLLAAECCMQLEEYGDAVSFLFLFEEVNKDNQEQCQKYKNQFELIKKECEQRIKEEAKALL